MRVSVEEDMVRVEKIGDKVGIEGIVSVGKGGRVGMSECGYEEMGMIVWWVWDGEGLGRRFGRWIGGREGWRMEIGGGVVGKLRGMGVGIDLRGRDIKDGVDGVSEWILEEVG